MTEENQTENTEAASNESSSTSLVDLDLSDVHKDGQLPEQQEAPTRPEGIPDELWDAESNDIKRDELIKAYQSEAKQKADLRKALSKKGGVPAESEEDYKLELDDSLKEFVPDDDPALDSARKAAFDAGLTPEQFNKFVGQYMAGLKEGNLLQSAEPRLTEEEQATLQAAEDQKFRDEQLAILGEQGQKDLQMLSNEVKALYTKGSLTDEDIEAFREAAFDAKGVRMMAKLMNIKRGRDVIPTEHAIQSNSLTKDELDAMGMDPRMKTDPAFRKRRSEGYRKLEQSGML